MIGVTHIWFNKIILVGMDYLSSKPVWTFYEFGIRSQTEDMSIYWEKAKYFIDHVTNKIKIGIEFLTLKDNCDFLKNIIMMISLIQHRPIKRIIK